MKNLFIVLILLFPFIINAQLGSANNGNPPGIKWKEISNESARIIFPEGLEKRAFRVADVIDYLNKNNRKSIGSPKGKINIILQNQLTEANGFVTAAPFRSEFFTTAPQRSFLGTNDWLDMLAIHEYRHVMQLQFAKQGATKVGSILFGDIGWIGMGFLSIPFWFSEGDAVMQETLLSEGGRGRSGSFLAEYRAMHEAGIKYPYEKIRNRSFKSILPNRYRMGYLFSLYGRNRYGNNFWKNVSKDAVRYKGLVWSFSQSLKKKTGKNVHHFYNMVMDDFYKQWDIENKTNNWIQAKETLVNKPIPKNRVTYYSYPKFIDNKVLTIKTGRDRIPAFYLIDRQGNEKKLFSLGYHDSYFNYKNDKMVWTQSKSDIRWSNRTYSNVYIYDFKKHKKKKLTNKSKYFSPDINADGTKILVVKSDEFMNYKIDILDSKTGNIIKSIPNPKNIFLSSPKWFNNETIITVAQSNQKNALVKIDISSGKMKPIIDYTHSLILHPTINGGFVYFSGDLTNIRNIFAVNLKSKQIYQVTNSKVLAVQADISDDGKNMLYKEQQINGDDIKSIKLSKEFWKPINKKAIANRYEEFNSLVDVEKGNILNKIPSQEYIITDYHRIKESIKIHSWYPSSTNINNNYAYGLTLHSTNLLSTLDLTLTPMINTNGETKLSTGLVWNKYYPILSLNYDISKISYTNSSLLQNYYYAGIKVPLNFSSGAIRRGLIFDSRTGYQSYKTLDGATSLQPDNRFIFTNKLSIYNKRSMAFQQLNPRFGQEFDIELRSISKDLELNENIPFAVNTKLYFPGIKRTHSLTFAGHFHQIGNNIFSLYSKQEIRGVKSQIFGINHVFRAEYRFPICYPDFALSNIAFIKRLRANLFYDYGYGEVNNTNKTISSFGFDLMIDSGIFNFGSVANFPFGVRITYLNGLDYKTNIQFVAFNQAF